VLSVLRTRARVRRPASQAAFLIFDALKLQHHLQRDRDSRGAGPRRGLVELSLDTLPVEFARVFLISTRV
jgi:hypothetical protein